MVGLLESKEKIVEIICSKTGKSREEVEELINKKKEKFSGLLTDSGAAFIIAKELNIGLDIEEAIPESIKISQLEEGMNNLNLVVRVLHVFSPKKFEKNGKKGVFVKLLVGDETGETTLTLWHDDVKKFNELKVQRNSVLKLKNCFVSVFNEEKQLSLSKNGSFELVKEKDSGMLPKAKDIAFKIKDLVEGMNEVDVVGRIIRIFPKKSFESNERKGFFTAFELGDDTARIRAVAWNDLAVLLSKMSPGIIVRIEGAYTKKGLQGIELHLGWRARIIDNVPVSFNIPELKDFLIKEIKEKNVLELKEKDSNIKLNGKIVSIGFPSPYYLVCPKCNGKVKELSTGFECEKCGQIKKPLVKAIASIELDDGKGIIRAVCFRETAEKLLGITQKDLEEFLKQEREKVLEELSNKIVGKNVSLIGNVKKSSFSEELELIVREVEENSENNNLKVSKDIVE
jgi:replication factor A1